MNDQELWTEYLIQAFKDMGIAADDTVKAMHDFINPWEVIADNLDQILDDVADEQTTAYQPPSFPVITW